MAIPNRNHGLGMLAGTRMGPRHWRPPRGGPAQRHIRASSRGRRRREKSLEVHPASAKTMSKVRYDPRDNQKKEKKKIIEPRKFDSFEEEENGVWGLRCGLGRGERMAGGPSR